MMNLLIDIGHPAHVHYFKNLIRQLISDNYKVIITVKEIPSAIILLESLEFEYIILPKKTDSLVGKIHSQIRYDYLLLKICRKFKIDVAIGVSITIAHITRFSKVKSIMFDDDDDDVQSMFVKYGHRFTSELLSPDVLKGKQKKRDVIYYPGYHELAYLYPNRFTPDISVLNEIGLKKNEVFFLMRFNVFKAHHDKGIKGLSLEHKLKLIELLEPFGKIFITTEREIEPELSKYQLKIDPAKIHSLMFYATIFLGDSQTMTSEAAVLGVPSLRCNSFAGRISYLEELEHKYGLTYVYQPSEFGKMLEKLKEMLSMNDIREEWQSRRHKMLSDKIDVTSFWVWFIDNYPVSVKLVRDEPEFWQQFR